MSDSVAVRRDPAHLTALTFLFLFYANQTHPTGKNSRVTPQNYM